jgi:3-deoxy-D-manno-octulosonic-acid transferase
MERCVAYLTNLLYVLLIVAASPWLLYAALRHGKYRAGWRAKLLGDVPPRTGNRPGVWLHAVSVGEVNLLARLLDELAVAHPDWECVITTTTVTGHALAQRKYGARYCVSYCPLDFSWAVRRALARWRPERLILAELELWPNLITLAAARGVRVAVINGRLSERSFERYRLIRPLVRRLLARLDLVAVQDAGSAERFAALGAPSDRLVITGNMKYDGAETERGNPHTLRLARLAQLGDRAPVWLAGSTQAPEEEIVLGVFARLRAEFPALRLILVPRHAERFDEVAALLARGGLPFVRRSELADSPAESLPGPLNMANGLPTTRSLNAARSSNTVSSSLVASDAIAGQGGPILLVDRIGELGAWWGLADVGFVGGSLGSRGGQNMIEPAAYGVATCFGTNTRNFRDIVTQLLAHDAARVVGDGVELEAFVRWTLTHREAARALGARARTFVLGQQGATRRTLDLLESRGPHHQRAGTPQAA